LSSSLSLSPAAQAAATSTATQLKTVSELSIELIPDGYSDGRNDVKYGTYTTVVGEGARPYQDRLQKLDKKAYGLSLLADEDPVYQSELNYLLENEVMRLYLNIANAPAGSMTDFERESLLYGTIQAYNDVRHHSSRLYEDMIRYIDVKLPGPNGQQIKREIPAEGPHAATYEPNYRSDVNLTDQEKQKAYDEKLNSFLKKGGSLSEVTTLTPEAYARFPQYLRVEYAWLANDEVKITPGNAGHLLLAQGAPVKCAGQFVFIKGSSPGSAMMIVTNASGTYKPDLLSAQQMASHLQELLQIPAERTVVVKGEPLSTQAVKIYLKGQGGDPAAASATVKELEARGKKIMDGAVQAVQSTSSASSSSSSHDTAPATSSDWLRCAALVFG
jgi:hypothetical protein